MMDLRPGGPLRLDSSRTWSSRIEPISRAGFPPAPLETRGGPGGSDRLKAAVVEPDRLPVGNGVSNRIVTFVAIFVGSFVVTDFSDATKVCLRQRIDERILQKAIARCTTAPPRALELCDP